MALVGKWLWRLKTSNNGLWFKVLSFKYGNSLEFNKDNIDKGSFWWRDLTSLYADGWGGRVNWFKDKFELGGGYLGDPNRFVVKEVYKELIDRNGANTIAFCNFIWNKKFPCNILVFLWRVLQNKLPTRDNLRKLGILRGGSERCPFGYQESESISHLLFDCYCLKSV
ncbi:unnamed protein product [Lathyrus sativus]|nr:unnamed protein product [Lathyrus sativus]